MPVFCRDSRLTPGFPVQFEILKWYSFRKQNSVKLAKRMRRLWFSGSRDKQAKARRLQKHRQQHMLVVGGKVLFVHVKSCCFIWLLFSHLC